MIVTIDGDVNYPITLDPTVWIFDKRKFPIQVVFPQIEEEGQCIHLNPFLHNAEPMRGTSKVICVLKDGEQVTISLEQANAAILRFSRNQKALKEDGPIWLYLADGSNVDNPIRNIRKFEVK
ncbi:MAG: hypothetical protein A6D91_10295 [Bacillaceae bacterium G1]|nr:MAG: hypothetical protein A6D91_10295 [Bacillaceae bacterium G1]